MLGVSGAISRQVAPLRIHRAHLRQSTHALFKRLFPERQIFFRSEGEVHFKRLSPRFQMTVAAIAGFALLWVLATSIYYLTGDVRLAAKDQELRYMSGELDALLGELTRLQNDALARAERIEQRQRFLDSLLPSTPEAGAVPGHDATLQGATTEKSEGSHKREQQSFLHRGATARAPLLATLFGANRAVAGSVTATDGLAEETDALLGRLARIAAHQDAQARALAAREEERLRTAQRVVARLGLDFKALIAAETETRRGVGGPLLPVPEEPGTAAFRKLLDLVGTRRQFDAAVLSIPSRVPADNYYVSSRFGQRRDPFRKTWAMHSGVDMAGWPGEPIYAAGDGLVVKAGRAPAYGLMVEIDHGNGFRTRYGHMRKLKTKAGQRVTRGTIIGEMGTSGRSTSTHLHWEVWFRGKLVDPMRYLEASKDVFALQNRVRTDG